MKADQDRVRMLITQTITMLCKKGLEFETELKVQGLLGVTVDSKDIFLIHLNEKYDNVSDTKDILPRQDSVATSTGNDQAQFSPLGISPDNGTACETACRLNSDNFGLKKEPDQISPLQPNFNEFHDSMSDLFPYAECHTTENALLTGAECSQPGFLIDTEPAFSANMLSALKDMRSEGKTSGSGGGIILLDSGDEGEDFKHQPMRQMNLDVVEMDSKNNLQMIPDNKMALQTNFSQQLMKPLANPNAPRPQSVEMELASGSAQSWALQPVVRSQFPAQSPGRQTVQGQQFPFNPEHIGRFSIGSNRPPAIMPASFHGRAPSRRPGGRQPRPSGPGRGGVMSPVRQMRPNEEMNIRYSGSPSAASGSMLGSPHMSGMSLPPVRESPPTRGAPRGRNPRASGAMLRGGGSGAYAGTAMEFPAGLGASPRGQAGAPRMSRGATSVRTRSVDGYSYGKQTVTNYICNICNAVYKNHSSLLTHQVKIHGRQKKEGKGRPKLQLAYDDDDDEDDDTETEEMGEM